MQITIRIDADTPEGKQIINYLKDFPGVVTFEDEVLNELQQVYLPPSSNDLTSSGDYVPVEEFRVEAKKRAKAFLEKHGLHS
ncbi:hypothetical protein [uncultured Proteiniphilum sp.]|uniref:hypothetical protein n=1 Tax=uncultured Proteiniphilum sp. TaxID=497637 RepID=UPI00262B3651|nr:hypothetical protein [uncultured Proteiniphilum sp.]